tara:strand:- start:954 stop:1139 length:186 start_codon:yes stop_codon:yes gene_type:complete
MKLDNKIKKPTKETAEKALSEAQLRNAKKKSFIFPNEINGPRDLEPTRFGDWERKGIASDF